MQKVLSFKRDTLLAIGAFFAVFLALWEIEAVSEAMRQALSLCAVAIVPSLFPFMILTSLLSNSRFGRRILSFLSRPFGIILGLTAPAATAYFLGLLFGFPLGARSVALSLKEGILEKEEGEKVLLFCNNASPAFVIGSVGKTMLGDIRIGFFLFLLQFVTSFFTGLLLRRRKNPLVFSKSPPQALPLSFSEIVRECTLQMLTVCSYVLFFSVIATLLSVPIASNSLRVALACFLEIGAGCGLASSLLPMHAIPFCAFAICFSGISVFYQCKDAVRDTDLTMQKYLPIKLLCGLAGFILASVLCPF